MRKTLENNCTHELNSGIRIKKANIPIRYTQHQESKIKLSVLLRVKSNEQYFRRTLTLAAFIFSLIRSLTERSAKPALDVDGAGGKPETEKTQQHG